jgi:ADP-dependent NAD(P)H-hydrate dehydratase
MNRTPPLHPADGTLQDALRRHPLPPHLDVDKQTRGTVLVIGGSPQTPGAVLLAGRAALRVGAGRLQLATVPQVVNQLAVAVPEAMVMDVAGCESSIADADAIVVGPGFTDVELATSTTCDVLTNAAPGAVIVLDAMAIGVLPDCAEVAARRRGHLVITPNRAELASLVSNDDAEAALRLAARRYGAAICCFEYVALPDSSLWRDERGVVGLGTSGAGDVLAGLAGGTAARSGHAVTAACWAAAVHRGVANRVASDIAPLGYLASDLVDAVPAVLNDIEHRRSSPS